MRTELNTSEVSGSRSGQTRSSQVLAGNREEVWRDAKMGRKVRIDGRVARVWGPRGDMDVRLVKVR